MFRQALSEVRHHPGRFISTLLAIAISVAFLAGSATLVATEGQAQGKAMNVAIAQADLVITFDKHDPIPGVGSVLAAQKDLAAYTPVLSTSVLVRSGAVSQSLQLVNVPPQPLRWAQLTAGHWPEAENEIALSAGAAQSLGTGVGQPLRLVGSDRQVVVSGITNEPSGMFAKTGYASTAALEAGGASADVAPQWAIKVKPGVSISAAAAELNPQLAQLAPWLSARPGDEVRAASVAKLAGDFDVFANVLWGFGAVAVVVGMITIANTFSITLAQRRRQIGLLRAVGAAGSQVRRRFLAEALVLGLVGSLLGLALGVGLAAAVTAWSSALFWGLALPWSQLAIAVGVGVVATMVAAFVPVLRGTRVAPLEALQPVLASDEQRRASVARAVICGLLVLAGAGLAVVAVVWKQPYALLVAIGSGALISAGVLFGGPLFVPSLLRLSGRLVRVFGTVPRLAADNAERNPRRATATATALMLAIGLMVTLQVATASIRATVLDQIQQHYPVDLQVAWTDQSGNSGVTIPATDATKLAAIPGVANSVLLPSTPGTMNGQAGFTVLGYQAGVATVTSVTSAPSDQDVFVNPDRAEKLPASVTVKGGSGDARLTVRPSKLADYDQLIVSSATLSRLGKPTPNAVMWLSIPDRSNAINVMATATDIVGDSQRLGGSIAMSYLYEQVLNILLAITTALLGVAVLIALIGVSNTLGLSVLERRRESALLRALGLQASSLRAMLTIEAMQVTLVGVLVGVIAGGFFGWLAATATGQSGGFDEVRFAVDVPQTLGMIAIAMVAAGLASVLPGRRAAQAAPTEALADI